MTDAPADAIALRLSLLTESGQITERSGRLAVEFTDQLLERFAVTPTDEERAPFVVHVALAFGRAQHDEASPEVPEAVRAEVLQFPDSLAVVRSALTDVAGTLGHSVAGTEAYYIAAHILALMAAEGAG